ncbi:MAG: diguanylate cyclase [Acidobacteria bacterium]|nr:MAG: diguanylate cyclase [Acidobacteriota bacterium]
MAEPHARRVLVVDDDPGTRELVEALCRQAGVPCHGVGSGGEALRAAARIMPDLILLDMMLPDLDGIDVLQRLRADERLAGVPVVILSARRSEAVKVRAFEAGADDYVVKPFSPAEIDARIRANLRKRDLYLRLEEANRELMRANRRLEELATTDELTGLFNLRHLRERLDAEFRRAERYRTPLSLVMIDLDGFKALNDERGHAAGDALLAAVGRRLAAGARSTDVAARIGGDEFVVLLPQTDLDEARRFAERLRRELTEVPERGGVGVSFSCGVACYPATAGARSPARLLAAADEAMYRAKRSGEGVAVATATSASVTRHTRPCPRPSTPQGPGAR